MRRRTPSNALVPPAVLSSLGSVVLPLLMVFAVTTLVRGQPIIPLGGGGGEPKAFDQGWRDFLDVRLVLELLGALAISALLAAAIAYHPKSYGKAATLNELEQPKTFIMYAVVGAMVAKVVVEHSPMAFVIFGIGGLLRFRTDVGAAKDTGRVILVTIVGLACGMNLFLPAVLGTAVGWVLIYSLEARTAFKITVKGLDPAVVNEAADSYHQALLEAGCEVMRERKNFVKGQVSFVFRGPGGLSREDFDDVFAEVPEAQQGGVDWNTT